MLLQPFYQAMTDFIFIEEEPVRSDVIFIPGGNYPDAALRAARLYRDGYAPYLLPSGKFSVIDGIFTGEGNYATEWEYLTDILKKEGVPETAILKEDQATYTYENAIYSRQVLEKKKIPVKTAILCCQAFHSRRCFLYYQEQFPDTRFTICPVVTRGICRDNWFQSEKGIDTVLGEIERCGVQFHEILKKYSGL